MKRSECKIIPGYLNGQAISYFFLSILLIKGAVTVGLNNPLKDKPTFFIDRSSVVPFPVFNLHINLAYWLIIIVTFFCLSLSLYFFIALFRERWRDKAKNIAYRLSIPFAIFVFMSFIIAWSEGLVSLTESVDNPVIFGIFSYTGMLIFILILIHVIWNYFRIAQSYKQNSITVADMMKNSLPSL